MRWEVVMSNPGGEGRVVMSTQVGAGVVMSNTPP